MEIKTLSNEIQITKVDMDKKMIFGFFNVSKVGDDLIVDSQLDSIETEELEKAAYDFVLNARIAGEQHVKKGVGNLVESMMFTYEKQEAILATIKSMGVENPAFDLGIEAWWGGFEITDPDVLTKMNAGEYPMFSVGGAADKRIETESE